MTLDEAIKHCLEVAEQNEFETRIYDELNRSGDEEYRNNHCQCAADHRQLAEWLTELQELRCRVMRDDPLIEATITMLDTELKEAKRLLKLAVEDMYNSVNDVHCKYCSKWHTDQCQGTSHLDCYIENKFKWRYTDEALKLIGDD